MVKNFVYQNLCHFVRNSEVRPIYDKYYFYMKMLIGSECAVIRLITAIGANRVPWQHPRGVSMSGRFQELW